MRYLFVLLILTVSIAPSYAEDPSVSVEFHQLKAVKQNEIIKVGFSVKNLTDELLSSVYVECAGLDESGNVIDTGIEDVSNLHAGETSHSFVNMTETKNTAGVHFECRVSDVHH